MSEKKVPLEYLRECSNESMSNFVSAQLNRAAEIRKGIRADLEQLVESLVNAEVARVLMQERDSLREISDSRQRRLEFGVERRQFKRTA